MTRMAVHCYVLLLCVYSARYVFVQGTSIDNQSKGSSTTKANEITNVTAPEVTNVAGIASDGKKAGSDNAAPSTGIGSSKVQQGNSDVVPSDAIRRGMYLFVGITMLFLTYVALKTCRRRNKSSIIIKKYGVRTKRTDVEMEPLPIDEEEEDETVFDLGHINNR